MYGPVRLWYAPGALLVRSRFAGDTLKFGGAVWFGSIGAVRSAHYRLCARLGFVHVADSCDVESTPCYAYNNENTTLCALRKLAFF